MTDKLYFDLCAAQEGLWFAQNIDPENPLFNTGQFIELTGPLDLAAFKHAHAKAMKEAQTLRLQFSLQDGRPVQALTGMTPELQVVDLRADLNGFETARAAMDRDSATPTDPTCDPMAAFVLFRLSDTEHLWYERIHHLATDGYGMVLLTNRVGALYGENLGQRPSPPLAPFNVATQADKAYRTSVKFTQDRAFWMNEGTDLGAPASPNSNANETLSAHQFHRVSRVVPKDIARDLLNTSQEFQLSWPDVLTLLSGVYLRRVSPDGSAVLGLPFMARFGTKAARVPCMWMNVLPHSLSMPEDKPLRDALVQDVEKMTRARKSGLYRSEILRRDLNRTHQSERLYGPLINVQPFDFAPKFFGLETQLHILSAGPVDDLNVSYRGDGKTSLTVEIDANPDLYSVPQIEAHLDRLMTFISRALQAETLQNVPTLTDSEQAQLGAFNATDHDVEATTLTALIEAQMSETPEAPAVRFGEELINYAELDRRSKALAERLVEFGAGKDKIVAVALERSIELAVALVAIERAGAAYAPLDPSQPPQRLAALIKQTEAVALLATADLDCDQALSPFTPDLWPLNPKGTKLPMPAPEDLSYVLFTSGSTGMPKGVMIEHRAIVNRLLWMRDHYGFDAQDRILQKTPITFDVSVWELFLPYVCGGTLIFLEPDAHRDPAEIARTLQRENITACHFVPSMLAVFLDHPDSEALKLKHVFCSGEALSAEHRDRFHARITASLHNLYGPTEAAVDVTAWTLSPQDTEPQVPIGCPVWNTQTYILDETLRPVPQGVCGQLYLGGVQLARGYLGQPELTNKHFVPDPFHHSERLYATGDLARQREDGAIMYLGRNDHQIKIRGMRVELGEIEHALRALKDVRDAVVLARNDLGSHTRLIGYLVSAEPFDMAEAQANLARKLPAHMIPTDLITVPKFTTTANGKLDRKSLLKPVDASAQGTPAHTQTERHLAALYRDILNLPAEPPREADFFALGGDSLSAVGLQLAIETGLDRSMPLGQIFETPRIDALARALEDQEAAQGGLGCIFPLVTGSKQDAPLVLLHPAGGLCWGYRALAQAFSAHFTGPIFGVQSPVLAGAVMPTSLTALCRDYADLIEAHTDAQTLHLVGWSLGGILAQDLAVELASRGRTLGTVALLDAYPAESWKAEPEPDPVTALRALIAIEGHDPDQHKALDTRAKVVNFLKTNTTLLGALPREVLDAVVRLVTGTNQLMRAHEHRFFHGELVHIRAGNDHIGRGFTSQLWAPYCARLRVIEVPCLHQDMVSKTYADEIAKRVTSNA
jgi:enterobactin synthetase component F